MKGIAHFNTVDAENSNEDSKRGPWGKQLTDKSCGPWDFNSGATGGLRLDKQPAAL